MSNYKYEIRHLIAAGKTEQALLRLLEVKDRFDEQGIKQISIVSGRYYRWKNNSVLGVNENDNELRRVESAIFDILSNNTIEKKQTLLKIYIINL